MKFDIHSYTDYDVFYKTCKVCVIGRTDKGKIIVQFEDIYCVVDPAELEMVPVFENKLATICTKGSYIDCIIINVINRKFVNYFNSKGEAACTEFNSIVPMLSYHERFFIQALNEHNLYWDGNKLFHYIYNKKDVHYIGIFEPNIMYYPDIKDIINLFDIYYVQSQISFVEVK